MLTFANIAELQAQSVTDYASGYLAFVQSVRDFFVIEKSLIQGDADLIQNVVANGSEGRWYRLGINGNYWKNQTEWYIDADSGDDENDGSDGSPLETIDEVVRRFLGLVKITDDYTINLTSVTSSISNSLGMNVEFDGGSVTFQGHPALATNIGTITALSGAVSYSATQAPFISLSTSATSLGSTPTAADNNLLYASSSTETPIVGWATDGRNLSNGGTVFMTATDLTGAVGMSLYKTSTPVIMTPGIIARGYGDLIFNKVTIGVSTSANIILGGAEPASITLKYSSLESAAPELVGGSIFLDKSRVRSTSGSIFIHNQTQVYGSGSAIITPNKQINIRDSHIELGSSVLANSMTVVRGARVILSVPLASGCAMFGPSSSIEVQSDSIIDVRNLLMTMSAEGAGTTTRVVVTGQNSTVFYDATSVPVADNITINNGYTEAFAWSSMPYQEIGTNTLVTSGSLKSVLNPTD